MTVTWADLFERGESYDVALETIRATADEPNAFTESSSGESEGAVANDGEDDG